MSLEPRDFQRCALDLLRLEFGSLIPVDLPYGHNDDGYDGILYTATIDGRTGPWAVEVKRQDGKGAVKLLAEYQQRHPDRAVVFVVAGRLTTKVRDDLSAKGTPSAPVVVRDGADLASRARHAPWVAEWYFPDGRRRWLRPIEAGPPHGVNAGHLLPVERAARDAVAAALRDGKVVLVHGGARVRPALVAHEAARAFGAGGWWLGETASHDEGWALRAALGHQAEHTAVILPPTLNEDAARALACSRDLRTVPMIVPVQEAEVDAWRRRLHPRAHVVVAIERPKLAEILAWAQALGVPDAWGAVMRVTQPDRIEAGVGASPADLQIVAQALIDEVEAPALRAALLVAMSTPLKFVIVARHFGGVPITREALDAWSWEHDVDAAVRAGLLEPSRTGFVLVSPLAGLAAGEAVRQTQRPALIDTMVARARSGEDDALMWWVAGPEPTGLVPADALPILRADWDAVVAEVLEALTDPERVRLLVQSVDGRPFWAVSERWARWAMEVVEAGLRSGSPEVCAAAAKLAPRCALAATPWLATAAAELLVLAVAVGVTGLRSADQVEGAIAPLTAPGKVEPGMAADAMEALAASLRDAPSNPRVLVASAALRPWLRGSYRIGRLQGSTWVEEVRTIPADGPWGRAHAAARALLLALLESEHPMAFAQGLARWASIEVVADHPTGELALAALAVLRSRAASELPAAGRALLLNAGEELAVRAPTQALARSLLEPWRADVDTLILRATLFATPFVDDLADALAAIDRDDPEWLRRVLRPFSDTDAVVDRLARQVWDAVPVAESAARVHALLVHVDAGVRWCREAGAPVHLRPDALLALARERPEPFDALLTGPAWSAVPDALRPVVAAVLVVLRRQAIADAVERREGTGGFLRELLAFIASPGRFDTERGVAWLNVVATVTPEASAPAMLHSLVLRAPAALRPTLAVWLWRMLFGRRPLDPRDGEAIARALTADEDGWSLLVEDVGRGLLDAIVRRYPWLRQFVVAAAMRRFSPLSVEGPALDVQDGDDALASAWVAADHPEAWWHLRQLVFIPEALRGAGVTGTLALRLFGALPRALHAALVPWADLDAFGPVHPANRTLLRTAFAHVVRQVMAENPAVIRDTIASAPPDDDLRVALLLEAPAMDPVVETLRALPAGHADWFAAALATSPVVSGGQDGRARWSNGMETDDFDPPPLLGGLGADLEARAAREGGVVGAQLRAIAAQIEGRYTAPDWLALMERCKHFVQEHAHAGPA